MIESMTKAETTARDVVSKKAAFLSLIDKKTAKHARKMISWVLIDLGFNIAGQTLNCA
jgi:hypothetical protein